MKQFNQNILTTLSFVDDMSTVYSTILILSGGLGWGIINVYELVRLGVGESRDNNKINKNKNETFPHK
jgi:hypothetical protein